MTLDDKAEIVHSDKRPDGSVKVYIEKPDEKDCFHHMTCYLPGYKLEDVYGVNYPPLTLRVEVGASCFSHYCIFPREKRRLTQCPQA